MIQTNDNGLAITCPNILGYDGVIILKLDSEYNSCTMQTNVVPLVDTFNFDSTITPLIGSRGTVSSGGVLGSGGTIIQYCLITAGVEYNIKSLEFTIFPNPNNGTFHLEYSFPDNEKLEFVIYDIAGRELRKYILRPGKNSISINMEGLEEGFYIYQIRGNGYGDLMGKITVINNQR
ncbi:MAG: T9SS type A sorting domain-containing protein [Bacteroidetes bacterium]|nr:T9SS type A sorting domain-containing protein [Bacteroidota bacterium]